MSLWIVAAALSFAAVGCKKHHPQVREVTVAETAALLKDGTGVAVDANTEDFRKENGKLPGAILLANYREYDAKTVLGSASEKTLVFYCTSRL